MPTAVLRRRVVLVLALLAAARRGHGQSASAAASTTFDAALLRDLPSGRDVISLLETAEPGTVTDRVDGGGLWTADPARLTARGGSWTETTWRLDGVDVTDPLRGGRPLVLPHADALSSAALLSAALPADVPGSAAVVDLALAPPPATWRGTVHGDTSLGSAARGSGPPPVARLDSWRDVGVIGGGPAGDRAGVLGALEWRRSARFDRGDTTPVRSSLVSALAQAAGRASDRDAWHALFQAQWATRPADPGVWRGGADARDGRAFADARWERRDHGASWSARLSYARARTSGTSPAAAIERLLDGPVAEQVEERPATRDRLSGEIAFRAPTLHAAGAHEPRLGLSLERGGATVEPFNDDVAEHIAGLPARLWEYTGGTSRPRSYEVATTAADRATFGRLQAEAGLRVDHADGRAEKSPAGIAWWGLSPSLSLRWPVLARDGVVLSGAAGRRAHRLLLSWLEWGDPEAPHADVRRADRDGALVGRAGPGAPVGSLDPGLHRPYTDEVMLAVEGRVGDVLVVRFAGVDGRERRLIESVNVGLGAGAYATRFIADPGGDLARPEDDQLLPVYERRASGASDSLVLTNPAGLDARFRGVELTFDLHLGDRLRVLVSGTAHRVDGDAAARGFRAIEDDPGLVGERFDTPNADTNARGRLFFDRAYTIKLAGRWRAPGDVHLGWVARYQDGQPFARLLLVPDLPQGPDLVRAVPDGRHRFAYTLTVDARAEKAMRVGRHRVSASVEAFNVLQTRHEVEEDVLTGPAFRRPLFVQPPRTLRAGLRLEL